MHEYKKFTPTGMEGNKAKRVSVNSWPYTAETLRECILNLKTKDYELFSGEYNTNLHTINRRLLKNMNYEEHILIKERVREEDILSVRALNVLKQVKAVIKASKELTTSSDEIKAYDYIIEHFSVIEDESIKIFLKMERLDYKNLTRSLKISLEFIKEYMNYIDHRNTGKTYLIELDNQSDPTYFLSAYKEFRDIIYNELAYIYSELEIITLMRANA